jgi:ribonuclease VapC
VIVVDTSALMAILLNEPASDDISRILAFDDRVMISSVTLAEALIVAQARGLSDDLEALIKGLGVEIVDVTAEGARHAARAYSIWGKGRHPASLNFGDCFSYACAKELGAPLLFTGRDFAATDIVPAIKS